MSVGVRDPRCVLDLVLVERHHDVVARQVRLRERDEALCRTEEAGLGGHPFRIRRLVIEVHLPDATDPGAIVGDDVAAPAA